jgi:hypothetical protein
MGRLLCRCVRARLAFVDAPVPWPPPAMACELLLFAAAMELQTGTGFHWLLAIFPPADLHKSIERPHSGGAEGFFSKHQNRFVSSAQILKPVRNDPLDSHVGRSTHGRAVYFPMEHDFDRDRYGMLAAERSAYLLGPPRLFSFFARILSSVTHTKLKIPMLACLRVGSTQCGLRICVISFFLWDPRL